MPKELGSLQRPTRVLRRLLLLESMQALLDGEIHRLKTEMAEADLHILDEQRGDEDIWIQYRCHNRYDEAIFMRRMLDAEVAARARHSGLVAWPDAPKPEP